jgi:hypothetical protein
LNELESLLGGIESRLSPEAAPSLETLIRRLALIDDQAISSRLLSFLDRYHSGWQDQGRRSIRACLAWLKCVAVESRASGRSSLPSVVASTQLLEAYRSRSFMNKMAVWMIRPVRPEAGFAERWWEQSLVAALPAPAESGPGPKRPRGADLAGRIQAGAGSQQSLRK